MKVVFTDIVYPRDAKDLALCDFIIATTTIQPGIGKYTLAMEASMVMFPWLVGNLDQYFNACDYLEGSGHVLINREPNWKHTLHPTDTAPSGKALGDAAVILAGTVYWRDGKPMLRGKAEAVASKEEYS